MTGWRKESLYSEYYKRRCGCTVCFEASACFKLLTISKLWSAYLWRTHTHTLLQLLFPHVAAIPLSVGHRLMFEINTKNKCATLPPCVCSGVCDDEFSVQLCVCMCVWSPGDKSQLSPSVGWEDSSSTSKPTKLSSFQTRDLKCAAAQLCKPEGLKH